VRTPDPYGEWFISKDKARNSVDETLLAAAREAWPRVLAHARRQLGDKHFGPEKTAFAEEVWRAVIQSVARALQRRTDHQPPIADLPSYLISAFHHRFNRALKREQKIANKIEFVPSTQDLERFQGAIDSHWVNDLERTITINEIMEHMDSWTLDAWKARELGYSWKEIAEYFGRNEQQVQMKFRYGLKKTRDRLFDVWRQKGKKRPPES
jgi:DNA-directed RNA polymerase specialized sigma24 family protein